jgi:ABC-type uncharacterized transport system substrate-binding protein
MGLESFKTLLCLVFLCSISSFSAYAENKIIAIIKPSTDLELSRVHQSIIDGIEQSTPKFEKKILILKDDNKKDIVKQLFDKNLFAIIAIGNETTDFMRLTSVSAQIFTIATLLPNDGDNKGVSLSMDQETIKKKIRLYLPHIQKIYIGDKGENIIRFSKDSLNSPKFSRKIIAKDERSIVKHLWQNINDANPKTEAVWINNHIDPLLLYKLLEFAWERNVALISNNITHLEGGSLLALYPDFKGMGERLGEIISGIANKKSHFSQLETLKAISLGINLRAAKHLGIQISEEQESEFGVIIK